MSDLDRILESVWMAAVDAITSDDFRDDDELDEEAYLRYKANTVARAADEITQSRKAVDEAVQHLLSLYWHDTGEAHLHAAVDKLARVVREVEGK